MNRPEHPTLPISPGKFDPPSEDEGLCLFVACANSPPEVHPLPSEGVVTLGRGSDQQIVLNDATISRRHATLLVRTPPLLLTNLSRNGTLIGARRLAPGESEAVYVAQQLQLSPTTYAWVQRRTAPLKPWQIYKHAAFLERLAAACARAQHDGLPFAVVRLRCDFVADEPVQQVLAQETIATDVAAAYAPPREYELLLHDTNAEEARARAERIAQRLADYDGEVAWGVASWPEDGSTAEELFERASAALRLEPGSEGDALIYRGGEMGRLYDKLDQLAAAPALSVLLLGETGVGKRIFAQRLHRMSPRARGPFVTLNIASLPESLLEAELFGHTKGAFSGAIHARTGILVQGNGGTVFLDEIGELPMHLQVKLLNVIEDRQVRPLGSDQAPIPIDVRFVSATNRDLRAEVEAGRFRLDLFYRLADARLQIPPLRERAEEIEPLARAFVEQTCREARRSQQPALSREAIEVLRGYRWEGNIRQLRSVIATAVYLCKDGIIRPEDLEIFDEGTGGGAAGPAGASASTGATGPASGMSAAFTSRGESGKLRDKVAELQKNEVLAAINRCNGNQSEAARALKISRGTLIKLLKKYGFYAPRQRPRTGAAVPGYDEESDGGS